MQLQAMQWIGNKSDLDVYARKSTISYDFLVFSYSGVNLMTLDFISHQIGFIQKSFSYEIGFSPNIMKSTYAIAVKFPG